MDITVQYYILSQQKLHNFLTSQNLTLRYQNVVYIAGTEIGLQNFKQFKHELEASRRDVDSNCVALCEINMLQSTSIYYKYYYVGGQHTLLMSKISCLKHLNN